MELRDYQEKAIKSLKAIANDFLQLNGSKTIIFEAPTGSGKTVMMAEFLKQFVEDREDGLCFSFIWAAPRHLHTQSKEKLEEYYFDSKALRCSSFEDLEDGEIRENEILFLNWESINKADNIFIRDNETDFNLSHIIAKTVVQGRTLVMVIDESHFAAKTETSLELIQMLQPKITLEVSATPHIKGDEHVTVQRERVIEEGMIKKSISLNPGFKNIIQRRQVGEIEVRSSAAQGTNELVISAALKKREMQKKLLLKSGSAVNPLLLVQLPDRREGIESVQQEVEQILKNKHGIETRNGRLAIYLSEDKTNLEDITRNDSQVEVMLFKQAIALGWDCPRASILVLFRDWKSFTFSIQTLGRILRMPEHKHYGEDELNIGTVFTNLSDISIQEDIARSYMTAHFSKRAPAYKPISLYSVHSKRFREETRLSPKFISNFLSAARELNLASRIDVGINELNAALLSDGIITNPDKPFAHLGMNRGLFEERSGETVQLIQTEREVQMRFDLFIRDQLAPFAPEKRSLGRVKDSIYRFLKHEFPTMFEYGGIKGQVVVLSSTNRQAFVDTINRAKDLYRESIGSRKKELIVDPVWEVPDSINFGDNYTEQASQLCIMEPFFESNDASTPERDFVRYLEAKKGTIRWWYKNGSRDGYSLAVPYVEGGVLRPFYVDWIVQFRNGKIGLFDTKGGITAREAKDRAEGLAEYIKKENSKGKKLFGGIVIKKERSWRLNDREEYRYAENDLSDWKYLDKLVG